MKTELPTTALGDYVDRQLKALFDDGTPGRVGAFVPAALDRLETCVAATRPDYAYFWLKGRPYFNHRNSDLYAMFLYLLGNTAHREGASEPLCEKLFLLNKALHGIDVFYSVMLPAVFVFAHPVATVLGRATYGDRLLVYQRVTVGSSHNVGDYPTIGRGVTLYSGATLLGSCTIGDGSTIAAGALLLNRDVPTGSLYTGAGLGAKITPTTRRDPMWR